MEEEFRISRSRVPGRGTLRGFKEELTVQKVSKVSYVIASDVKEEKIEWFWYPYIPLRKLSMLGGDPGMGKSFISAAIVAAVSRGEPLPGVLNGEMGPQKVIMFAGEDDLGDTIRPRLRSLGADLSKVALVDANIRLDADGLATVQRLVREWGARLFVIDPIVAYMGAKIDMNKSNEVRPMLKGLADIAKEEQAAGLIIRHLRKQSTNGSKTKALYMGMGSIDFTAAVRSELQVEEGKDGTKFLNHVKTNIGAKGKSITYSIIDDQFEWGEIVDLDPVFASSRSSRISTVFAKEDRARRFIFDRLKDAPEGVHSNDMYEEARALGIPERVLKSAKKDMAIVVKIGDHWIWKLNPMSKITIDTEVRADG